MNQCTSSYRFSFGNVSLGNRLCVWIVCTCLMIQLAVPNGTLHAQASCALQRFSSPSGRIADRTNAAPTYAPNQDCLWLIEPMNARVIRLSVAQFSTEINADILTVYAGRDTTAPVVARLSGQSLPAPIVVSSGAVLLRFQTNASAEESGWQLDYLSSSSAAQILVSQPAPAFAPILFGTSTETRISITPSDTAFPLVLTTSSPFQLALSNANTPFSDTLRIPASVLQASSNQAGSGAIPVQIRFQPNVVGKVSGQIRVSNGAREFTFPVSAQATPAVFWRPANGPFSAQVRSLTFAPNNTILAGTLTGVYRSNASGAAWLQAAAGLNANSELVIQTLASSNRTSFAGTAQGFFASKDGGRTWFKSAPALANASVESISVRRDTVFVVSNGQMFRSANDGEAWERVQSSRFDSLRLTTVFASPVSRRIFAAGNRNTSTTAQILVSENNGITWQLEQTFQADTAKVTSITEWAASRTDTSIFVATAGNGLFRKQNAQAWERVQKTLRDNDLVRDTVTQLAASRAGIFAATNDGVFRSTDGGTTWKQTVRGLADAKISSLIANDVELYAGTSVGVYRSTTGGEVWQPVSTGLTGGVVTAIKEIRGFLLAGTLGSGIFRSSDNGFTWQLANNGLTARSLFNFVSRAGIVFTTSFDGYEPESGIIPGVYRSADNGLTWTQVLTDSVGFLRNAALNRNSFYGLLQTERALYAGSGNGHVWVSQTGFNWRLAAIPGVVAPVTAIAEGVGESIFAATLGNGVYRSDDNGSTWRKMMLAMNNANGEGAYSMIANASGTIFVGTTDGLYRSRNNGSSWERLGNFPTLVGKPLTSMQIVGDMLYVATDGKGIWRTVDNGDSWEEANDGIAGSEAQVYSIFSANGTELYAGLRGGAVITSSLQLPSTAPRAVLEIPDTLQARVGDTVEVPIILRSLSGELRGTKTVSGFLRFNASMLMPLTEQERQSSIVANGERQMPIRFSLTNSGGNSVGNLVGMPLARIRLRAVLGNSAATPLILTNIQTTPSDAIVIMPSSGVFNTRGLFTGDGTRLYRSERAPVLASVAPNPASGNAAISYEIFGKTTVSISLLNIFGQTIQTMVNAETLPEGRYDALLNTSGVPTGTYFVRLQTPEHSTVRVVSVVR